MTGFQSKRGMAQAKTSMKDEALTLALEALEGLFGIPQQYTGEGGGAVAIWRMGGSDASRRAIAVIKEALAQPMQELSSVQQAYAMAQVCLDLHEALGCKWGDNPYLTIGQLKAAAQPPLPVQPQRPWVGLTDDERNEIWKKEIGWGDPSHDDEDLMKAIEQALKEKNK